MGGLGGNYPKSVSKETYHKAARALSGQLGVGQARDKSEQYDTDREKNEFLYLFYDKFFDKLIQPFMSEERLSNGLPNLPAAAQVVPKLDATGDEDCRIFICELLCFCVAQHGYRIKHYIFRHNIVSKILLLLNQKQKYLVLGAIRFLRACVGLKDDFYNRYIIKNHLFEPVMKVTIANPPTSCGCLRLREARLGYRVAMHIRLVYVARVSGCGLSVSAPLLSLDSPVLSSRSPVLVPS